MELDFCLYGDGFKVQEYIFSDVLLFRDGVLVRLVLFGSDRFLVENQAAAVAL